MTDKLKLNRRQRKTALSRILNTIEQNMVDNKRDTIDRDGKLAIEAKKAFVLVEIAHFPYHATVECENELYKSEVWFKYALQDFNTRIKAIDVWLNPDAATMSSGDGDEEVVPIDIQPRDEGHSDGGGGGTEHGDGDSRDKSARMYHSVTVNVNGVLKNLMVPVDSVMPSGGAAVTSGVTSGVTTSAALSTSASPSLTRVTTASSSTTATLSDIARATPISSLTTSNHSLGRIRSVMSPGPSAAGGTPQPLQGTVVFPLSTPTEAIPNILTAAAQATRPGVPSRTVVLEKPPGYKPPPQSVKIRPPSDVRILPPPASSTSKVIIVPSGVNVQNPALRFKAGNQALINSGMLSTPPVRTSAVLGIPASAPNTQSPMITFVTVTSGSLTPGSAPNVITSYSTPSSSAPGYSICKQPLYMSNLPGGVTSILKNQPKTVMRIVSPPGQNIPVNLPGLQNAKFLPVPSAMASLMSGNLVSPQQLPPRPATLVPPGAIPVPNLASTLRPLYTETNSNNSRGDSISNLKITSVYSMSTLPRPAHTQYPCGTPRPPTQSVTLTRTPQPTQTVVRTLLSQFPHTSSPATPVVRPIMSSFRFQRPPSPDAAVEATKDLMHDADRLLQQLNNIVQDSPSTNTESGHGKNFEVLAEWSQEDTGEPDSGPVSRTSSPNPMTGPGGPMPDLGINQTVHSDRRHSAYDVPPLLEKATDVPTVEQAPHSGPPQLHSVEDINSDTHSKKGIQNRRKKKYKLLSKPIRSRSISGDTPKEHKVKARKPRTRCRKVKSWLKRFPEYMRCIVNLVKLPHDLYCPVDLSETIIPGADKFVRKKEPPRPKFYKNNDHKYHRPISDQPLGLTNSAKQFKSILRHSLPSSPIKPISAPGSAAAGTIVVGSKTVPYQKISPVVPPSIPTRMVRPALAKAQVPTLQVVGGPKAAQTNTKGKFYLVKTSTGSFLVPIPENNTSGVLLKVPTTKEGTASPQILISPKAVGEKATLIHPGAKVQPSNALAISRVAQNKSPPITINLKSVFTGLRSTVTHGRSSAFSVTSSTGPASHNAGAPRTARDSAPKRPLPDMSSPDMSIITGSKPGRPTVKAEPVDNYQYSATSIPDDTEPPSKLPRLPNASSRIEELRAKLKAQQVALEEVRRTRAETKARLGDDMPSPNASSTDSTSEAEGDVDPGSEVIEVPDESAAPTEIAATSGSE